MLNSLLQPHPRPFLILETPDIERESSGFLLDFRKYGTRVFHFELVGDGRVALVDRRARFF